MIKDPKVLHKIKRTLGRAQSQMIPTNAVLGDDIAHISEYCILVGALIHDIGYSVKHTEETHCSRMEQIAQIGVAHCCRSEKVSISLNASKCRSVGLSGSTYAPKHDCAPNPILLRWCPNGAIVLATLRD